MATASASLQARIAAIKAKQAANLAALNGQASGESRSAQATQVAVVPTKITVPVPTPVPTPTPHVVKPSLVTLEGAGEYEPFKMRLAELEQKLDDQVPDYAYVLQELHREMGKDVNIVTILTEDEISIIVRGLAKHMDTTVVTAKKTSTKRTQPLQLDEL